MFGSSRIWGITGIKGCIFAALSLLLLVQCAMGAVEVVDNVQLTVGVNQVSPSWSPEGKLIAYASDQEIWLMNADGSNQKAMYTSIVWDGEPSFSSDGDRLYFTSDYVSPIYSRFLSIHVLSLDGKYKLQLTNSADQRSPSPSPDGTAIAYLSKLAGNYDIWLMDINGSNSMRLTESSVDEGAPSWSPDSQYVIYSLDGDIWSISKDGLYQNQLTGDEFDNIEPVFSPDGSKIAFTSNRDGNYDIWVMNSNATNAMKLIGGDAIQKNPAWSPDGKKIAYSSNQGGDYNIWLVSLEGMESEISDASGDSQSGNGLDGDEEEDFGSLLEGGADSVLGFVSKLFDRFL